MCKPIDTLTNDLRIILQARGLNVTNSNEDSVLLKYEIERAIAEINRCRRFKPTKDKPYDVKYEDLIIPLCLYSFSKIGAEGQTSHSENGITRNYTTGGDYPQDVLNGIIPLVK